MKRHFSRQPRESTQLTPETYAVGFAFSLLLTLLAFLVVWLYKDSDSQLVSTNQLILVISALAVVQLFVQLVFFLHLGRESRPWWNLSVLSFAAIVVLILVFGSLWIMTSLKNRGGHNMTSEQTETDIIEDEGFRPYSN